MDLAGLKVMVIDDSNTIRRSAEIFLAQAGCEVVLAEDGFDALAKIADHHPDVDLRYGHVDVRLTSHDVGGLGRRDVGLARKVTEAARTLGAQPDPDFEEDES